jgi:plastocyanin
VRKTAFIMILTCWLFSTPRPARGQGSDVSAKIVIHPERRSTEQGRGKPSDASDVVLWLSPLRPSSSQPSPQPHPPYKLLQKDKQFSPHLLVVPTGTSVEFPNADPFFHNVFSLYNGKRFDLGLYESGTSRSVKFDREGVSYIFCNIHPEMGAVVLALSTPFYAVTGKNGLAVIHGVPPGSYQLNVWSEGAKTLTSANPLKVIQVSSQSLNLGEIPMQAVTSAANNHKNKFGEDYHPSTAYP